MSIRQQQSIFARNAAHLIEWCFRNGYEVTLGEAHRPQWVADEYAKQGKGSTQSLHIDRLAIDLMLFRDGAYLTKTDDYRRAGEAWVAIHEMNRWGGNWKKLKDGNHFSMSTGDGRE
jgi:hypothetical protein